MSKQIENNLIDALMECRNRLLEYADKDELSGGYGYGCMDDPHAFVGPAVDLADEAIKEARK